MVLLQNYSHLNANAGRLFAGTTAVGAGAAFTPGNFAKSGAWNNVHFPDGGTVALPGISYPTGYSGTGFKLPVTVGEMSMRPIGDGSLSADLLPTRPMAIDLTGSGDLNATAGLVISMLLAMTGNGTLAATIQGRLNASIDMTGTGDLDASLSAIGNMLANLTGTGDLDATIAAYGNMAIDIVVTGTGLTTANVGQAVWAALAAANNDPGTMGEKLNDAGAAGDPWNTALPGAYADGSAGALLALATALLESDKVFVPGSPPGTGVLHFYAKGTTTDLIPPKQVTGTAQTEDAGLVE